VTIDEARQQLAHVPELTTRAMFGGHGIYSGGRIFAILVDGEIHLKSDPAVLDDYLEAGGEPFTYLSKDGPAQIKYYRFSDKKTLLSFVETAIEVGKRAPLPKKRK
jgi:DNA transformation protein and related proteins